MAEIKSQRYLSALGENLQKIMKHLMTNQTLARYLYYTDMDPLAKVWDEDGDGHRAGDVKIDVTPEMIYQKQVLIIPIIGTKDDSKSIISLKVLKGLPVKENSEFMNVFFNLEVFVPVTQWILKSDNLRPYLIMGEIEKSLEGKTINGLGKISSMQFAINFLTEEMSCFEMLFYITQYD